MTLSRSDGGFYTSQWVLGPRVRLPPVRPGVVGALVPVGLSSSEEARLMHPLSFAGTPDAD